MQITAIETTKISVPYAIDFDIAGGGTLTADHVLVELHTDAGVTGIGEASPSPFFSSESQETVAAVIDGHIAPALEGEDPSQIGTIHRLMDRAIKGNPFAKTAVDMACYDATGKDLGVPASTLLGGRHRDRISVGQSIGIKDTADAVADARMYVDDWGFNSIKIKVGGDPAEDLERSKRIIDEVGDDVPVRIDANQGFTVDVAIPFFTELEEYGDLLFVEQPVSKTDLVGMSRVTGAITTPVLADETVFGPTDAVDVIREQAADIISIKINKAGGLYRSQQIGAIAAGAELPLAIGSMVECGVGTAAGAQFAASQPHATYPSDVKGPSLMEGSILEEPVRIDDGYTYVPDAPGLGVALDEDAVEQYRVE